MNIGVEARRTEVEREKLCVRGFGKSELSTKKIRFDPGHTPMKTHPKIAVLVGKMANSGLVGLIEDDGLLTKLTRVCRPFCISEPVGVRDSLDDQLQDLSRFVQLLSSQALMSICWSA